MKELLLSLFMILTSPQGKNVWIVKSQVVAIVVPGSTECTADTHAKVVTTAGSYCVAEDAVDVARMVDGKD